MAGKSYQVGFVFGAKKASTFDGTFKSIGSSLKGIGKAIAGVAGAYVGLNALKGAVDTFATFEQSMANVQAVSGATADDFKKLEAAALEMGRKTSKTAAEAADALGYMALAGWDTNQSMKGLEPILRLSEAGAMDLAQASDLVTDTMSAMGIAVDDLGGYLDVVAKAQSKSNTNAQQMMEAYMGVGGTFKDWNTQLDESGALLGVLANRGIKGSEAGTAVNAIFANMTKTTGEASKAMKSLGVSMYDSQGNFRGVTAVFEDINEKTKGLNQQQRDMYLQMIGGKSHLDALKAIMGGMSDVTADGRVEFYALREELQNCDGALAETAEIMNNTMHGAFKRLSSATDDMKIQFVKTFEGDFTKAVNWAAEKIPVMTQKITAGIQKMATKAAPTFQKIKDSGVAAIGFIRDKWDQYGPGIIAFVTNAKNRAVSAFTWIRDTGQQAIERIQEKYVEIKPHVESFIGAIIDAGKAIQDKLQKGFETAKPVIEWIAIKGFPAVVGAAGMVLGKAADIYYFFKANWPTIKGIVTGIGIAFAAWNLPNVLAGGINTIFTLSSALVAIPGKVVAVTTSLWGMVGAKIADKVETLQLVGLYAKDFAMAAAGTLKSLALNTGAWIANTAQLVGQKVALVALKGAQLISTGVTTAMTAAQWALNAAFVASPVGWVVLAIGALIAVGVLLYKNWDTIKAKTIELWSTFSEKFPMLAQIVSGPIEAIKGVFGGLKLVFTGIIDFVAGVFTGDWSRAWEGVKNIFGGIFQSFASLAKTPLNAVIAIINGAIRGINKINVDVPDWVPVLGGKSYGFSIPEIPMLAKGGIARKPITAVVGEGQENEAIMPLSKLQDMLNFNTGPIAALIEKFLSLTSGGGYSGGGGGSEPAQIIYSPQYAFYGPTDQKMVESAQKDDYNRFVRFFKQYERDKKRKGLNT